MAPDPKDEKKPDAPVSAEVENAHASGDGALERTEAPLEPTQDAQEPKAEDQNHIPY